MQPTRTKRVSSIYLTDMTSINIDPTDGAKTPTLPGDACNI